MENIIAISGRPGLYELQTQTRVGVIATGLEDGKRVVTQPTDQLSVLTDIQVYTYSGEIPLKKVFKKINEKHGESTLSITSKASASYLKSFFSEVLPDYDEERVYVSDIKKIVHWYTLLQQNDRLDLSEEEDSKKATSE